MKNSIHSFIHSIQSPHSQFNFGLTEVAFEWSGNGEYIAAGISQSIVVSGVGLVSQNRLKVVDGDDCTASPSDKLSSLVHDRDPDALSSEAVYFGALPRIVSFMNLRVVRSESQCGVRVVC